MRRRRGTPAGSRVQRALRRSRRRRALGWLRHRWLSICGAIACGAGAIALLVSTTFHVEQIVVRGAAASEAAASARAAQLSYVVGHNIFLVNSQRVADEVASVPSVLHARVTPRLPSVVEIEIVERVPIATWQTADGAFLADDQGVLIGNDGEASGTPAGDVEQWLVVRDTTGVTLRLGDRVHQRSLLAARELVKALPAAGLRAKDVEFSGQGLVLTADNGWRIIFGDTDALNQKMANLAAAVEHARKNSLKVALLDLRPKDRPFYQLAS